MLPTTPADHCGARSGPGRRGPGSCPSRVSAARAQARPAANSRRRFSAADATTVNSGSSRLLGSPGTRSSQAIGPEPSTCRRIAESRGNVTGPLVTEDVHPGVGYCLCPSRRDITTTTDLLGWRKARFGPEERAHPWRAELELPSPRSDLSALPHVLDGTAATPLASRHGSLSRYRHGAPGSRTSRSAPPPRSGRR